MLQGIYDRQQAGELTPEQAKSLGANLLRGLSYSPDGYFWADTSEGVNVVLYGRPDVEGRNRLEDKDEKGNVTDYKRQYKNSKPTELAKKLKNEICINGLPENAPSSLHHACDELNRLKN